MITQRLKACTDCSNITNLLANIDCKIALEANNMYQNIKFMLNEPVSSCIIQELLQYKRILLHKYYNDNYAHSISMERIMNRIKELTIGTQDCKQKISIVLIPTTTTTTTAIPEK